MDDEEVVPAPPAPAPPGAPTDSDVRPEIIRLEFPITVVVVGTLSESDLRQLREAVIGELQDALDAGF